MVSSDSKPPGALVISLDYELIWGVRDLFDINHPDTVRVIQERIVVPQILELFKEYSIAATWAVVGILMAETRKEFQEFIPSPKPCYTNIKLNPYSEELGESELDDPLHYAHGLIMKIIRSPRQEIATHTYSHYYCLERGQNADSFKADLDSACSLAQKYNIPIRTIVFPRNQHNKDYDYILPEKGIFCYRGNQKAFAYSPKGYKDSRLFYKRLNRFLDAYFPISGLNLTYWDDVVEKTGLCNIAASQYLRPISKYPSIFARLRQKRLADAMEGAARSRQIFHLWMHPQDFGKSLKDNLHALKDILDLFLVFQKKYGMESLNMGEAADIALKRRSHIPK